MLADRHNLQRQPQDLSHLSTLACFMGLFSLVYPLALSVQGERENSQCSADSDVDLRCFSGKDSEDEIQTAENGPDSSSHLPSSLRSSSCDSSSFLGNIMDLS